MQQVGVSNLLIIASFLTLTETNKMTLSNEQLAGLIESYAEMIVDGMDMDDLVTFAVESLVAKYNKYTEAELLTEIEELYDGEVLNDLLESVAQD